MRAFPVRMPSGMQYWTVIGEDLLVMSAADAYLRHLRFGRDAAESTTKTYAGAVALYLSWCAATGQDWRAAAERMPAFVLWLRHCPSTAGDSDRRSGACGPRTAEDQLRARRDAGLPGLRGGSWRRPERRCSANSTSWPTAKICRRRRAARTASGGCG